MRRSRQHGPAFSPAGRSGGSQALQLPHLSSCRGSLHISPAPDRVLRKSEIPVSTQTSPIGEEVWRAPGPPAPTGNIFLRKFRVYRPPPAPRWRRELFSGIQQLKPRAQGMKFPEFFAVLRRRTPLVPEKHSIEVGKIGKPDFVSNLRYGDPGI